MKNLLLIVLVIVLFFGHRRRRSRRGPDLVVRAVRDARKAAAAIDSYLSAQNPDASK